MYKTGLGNRHCISGGGSQVKDGTLPQMKWSPEEPRLARTTRRLLLWTSLMAGSATRQNIVSTRAIGERLTTQSGGIWTLLPACVLRALRRCRCGRADLGVRRCATAGWPERPCLPGTVEVRPGAQAREGHGPGRGRGRQGHACVPRAAAPRPRCAGRGGAASRGSSRACVPQSCTDSGRWSAPYRTTSLLAYQTWTSCPAALEDSPG